MSRRSPAFPLALSVAAALAAGALALPAGAQPPDPSQPPTGATGATGPTGSSAPTGASGPTGATGPTAPPAEPDPYEGRLIRELKLLQHPPDHPDQVQPVTDGLERLIQNQVRSIPGLPFSRSRVREDITRLNRLGRFKTIESDVQLLADGSVSLSFSIVEQPLIQDVQVVGNRELTDQDILREVSVLSGTPIDRFQIDRAARQIEDLYRSKGYYQARVEIDEKSLAESQIVVFRVIEGQPVKVTQLLFNGNNAFSAKELRSQVKTTTYIPIIEKAPLDNDVLSDDKAALVKYYRDRGYLDARADARIQPSPDGKEASITFFLDEGPLYTLRSVHIRYGGVEGAGRTDTDLAIDEYRNKVLHDPRAPVQTLTAEQMAQVGRLALSEPQVAGIMLIKPGDVYSDDKMRKSLDAIRDAYGKLGFISSANAFRQEPVIVDPRPVRDGTTPEIDLYLFIEQGKRYLTGDVTVQGNEFTKQGIVLREMQVQPGRPLDTTKVEDSKRRLEDTRLFAPGSVKITLEPENPANPGVRDVITEVEETNTGEFNIGAAVSSDGGLIGLVGVKQRNFDIFDVPESPSALFTGHAFRGAGQTADLEIQPGTQQSIYSFTLTEPHLFESNYSASGTVFYRDRDYDQYTEERYGGHLGLGRRFGSVWVGNLFARVESISLRSIDNGAPVDVFEVQDQHILTGLEASFSRDTTDDRNRPSRGTRLELGAEQVGVLGGDFDFTHLKYSYTAFFPIYESFLGYKTVLRLTNRIEYEPQGQNTVPVYERLYLGGQSFRGFNFRAVSPIGIRHDTMLPGDDPVGGTFLFFAGAEITQPVYKDIASLVGFIDTGTVNKEFGLDNYRVSAGIGVRLYIKQLSPVPLAFDFGFPILRQNTDRERVFTFSLDIPYGH